MEYRKHNRYFAQIAEGVEKLAELELKALGAKDVQPGFRGLYFTADSRGLYAVNYRARIITRVLAPLLTFRCGDREDLYRAGRKIDWRHIFTPEQTFAVFANVSGNENINHSRFAGLCLKDSIADYFRSVEGKRPDVDTSAPDVWVNLHIEKQRGIISLDTSGGSLHRRGYRKKSVPAPMRETLAAAMVALCQWDGQRPLHDPMCGSGTLLCEALMHYCRIPSGILRDRFGFQNLPDFDPNAWEQVKTEADKKIRPLPEGLISGSDISSEAIDATATNCLELPEADTIKIAKKDFRNIPSLENHMITCNPPYGIRLKKDSDLNNFYKELGDFLKQRCKGSTALVYFGNREMIKHIGLKPSWKKPMRNAGLDGRVVKYELY